MEEEIHHIMKYNLIIKLQNKMYNVYNNIIHKSYKGIINIGDFDKKSLFNQ